jgi:hypothetical protein
VENCIVYHTGIQVSQAHFLLQDYNVIITMGKVGGKKVAFKKGKIINGKLC